MLRRGKSRLAGLVVLCLGFALLAAPAQGQTLVKRVRGKIDPNATFAQKSPPARPEAPPLPLPASSRPADPAYQAMFPIPRDSGQVAVTFHPDQRVAGKLTPVSFGMPFPPGFVSDPAQIALFDNSGREMEIFVKVISRWPKPVPHAGSIRSALVQFRDLMSNSRPRQYTLAWGKPGKARLAKGWPARHGWLPVEDGSYPAGSVREPAVYATLPPQWLGRCLIKGRTVPVFKAPKFDLYDRMMLGLFKTAINQVDKKVNKKHYIDWVNHHRPWQYDRSTAFFVVYLRTGRLEPLREAHRAAQYYGTKVAPNGRFTLLPANYINGYPDVKYGYPECFTIDYLLTGDSDIIGYPMNNTLALLKAWEAKLTPSKTFWTERHMAFNLLNATTSYEARGDPALLKEAVRLFEKAYEAQIHPLPGAPRDGCMIHTGRQHSEGRGWVCSPWMSVLTVDAMMRYYLISADSRVPKAVEMLADYIVNYATYKKRPHQRVPHELTIPYYLASSKGPGFEVEPYADAQHALDVSMIVAAADYFANMSGQPKPAYRKMFWELYQTAKWNLNGYYSKWNNQSGVPTYRFGSGTPSVNARKFNWWFRTTADMIWLLDPAKY